MKRCADVSRWLSHAQSKGPSGGVTLQTHHGQVVGSERLVGIQTRSLEHHNLLWDWHTRKRNEGLLDCIHPVHRVLSQLKRLS